MLSAIGVQQLEVVWAVTTFSCFCKVTEEHLTYEMDNLILEKTKRRTFTVL